MNDRPAGAKRRSVAFRLVRALLATVASLYLLAAATISFAQTRILYHPRKTVDATPADLGLKFEPIRLTLNAISSPAGATRATPATRSCR
jgi:hypothetical protein